MSRLPSLPPLTKDPIDDLQASIRIKFPTLVYDPTEITLKDKDDVVNRISAYFDFCLTEELPPTFTGLALALGLTRFKLKNISEDHPYYFHITKAKQYIIDFVERQLYLPKSSAGVAFWLKNNDDWQDKQDIEVTRPQTIDDILRAAKGSSTSLEYPSPIFYEHTTSELYTGEPSEQSVEVEEPLQDSR